MHTLAYLRNGKSSFSTVVVKALRRELKPVIIGSFACVCVCEADYLFSFVYFTANTEELKLCIVNAYILHMFIYIHVYVYIVYRSKC